MVQPLCEKRDPGKKDFQMQKAEVTRGTPHSLRNLEMRQRWDIRTGPLCQTALVLGLILTQAYMGTEHNKFHPTHRNVYYKR